MNDLQALGGLTGSLTGAAEFFKFGFLIFLIAPAIYASTKQKSVSIAAMILGLGFVVIYGVLNLITAIVPQWLPSQRTLMGGTIFGVRNGYDLAILSDLRRVGYAYTKREIDPRNANLLNFRFLLVTLGSSPSCLAILLETPDKAENWFRVAVQDDDVAPSTELFAEASWGGDEPVLIFWREYRGKRVGAQEKLNVISPANEVGCESTRAASVPGAPWSVFRAAFAQSPASDSDLTERLQSDDVIARRDARVELAKRGETAFPLIDELLKRKDYRLQLGALVALAGMNDEDRNKAPESVRQQARVLRQSADKTTRDTAVNALQEPAFCNQEQDKNRKPTERFLVICYWTKSDCERVRGPNLKPGVSQSACAPVQLDKASWRYSPTGVEGGWYQYSSTTFAAPFPEVQPQP